MRHIKHLENKYKKPSLKTTIFFHEYVLEIYSLWLLPKVFVFHFSKSFLIKNAEDEVKHILYRKRTSLNISLKRDNITHLLYQTQLIGDLLIGKSQDTKYFPEDQGARRGFLHQDSLP